MIVEKTQRTIKEKVENVHGIRQDRRLGFTNDWAAVRALLQGQTSSQTPRRPAPCSQTPGGLRIGAQVGRQDGQTSNQTPRRPAPRCQAPGGLRIGAQVGRQDSQNDSLEMDLSLDFPQTSAAHVLNFLDSDPPSPNGLHADPEGETKDGVTSPTVLQRLCTRRSGHPGRKPIFP